MKQSADKIHNLNLIRRSRGYRFNDRDPDMEQICALIDQSEMNTNKICEAVARISGGAYKISCTTIYNWQNGKTRRPQNFTMTWVAFALGWERVWTKVK